GRTTRRSCSARMTFARRRSSPTASASSTEAGCSASSRPSSSRCVTRHRRSRKRSSRRPDGRSGRKRTRTQSVGCSRERAPTARGKGFGKPGDAKRPSAKRTRGGGLGEPGGSPSKRREAERRAGRVRVREAAGALRHEFIGLYGMVERNWYLVKRYLWWEIAFFFWTAANTLTIVFIAKGVVATGGTVDIDRLTTILLIGAVIWSYLGIVFVLLIVMVAWA